MDEQFRPAYVSNTHQANANTIKYIEEERIQRENAYKQRTHINDYLNSDTGYATHIKEERIRQMKNGGEVLKAKGFSLFSLKESTERIYHKDKENHAARKESMTTQFKAIYSREKGGETVSDSKAALVIEYRELLLNCRVFDNEVRETVQETLEQHPGLLAGYGTPEQREEILSRLVTAFLPEREFHFNPPSGNQKSFVKDYLKSFRKNPVEAIKKMQQSLRGERLHRDFMDVNTGMQNFRMLYTDMVKRDVLAKVFPHIENTTPADRYEVEKMGEGVEARKTMIKTLLRMNGMTFHEDEDLEFNSHWENTKTAQNLSKAEKKQRREDQAKSAFKLRFAEVSAPVQGDKEAILTEYFRAYSSVREKEREINRYYKDQITAGITERGAAFNPDVIHKNYRSVQRFANEATRQDMFSEETESVEIPFFGSVEGLEGMQNVSVNSKKYHAHKYLIKELKQCIQDANYTRYRRERLKKMKASGTIPAGVLEKNRQKEELRLRLLENRIADFEALARLMEAGNFNPNNIENRLARLYETEILEKAKSMQQEQAMLFYASDADYQIRLINQNYEEIRRNAELADADNDNLSMPKSLYEEFLKREENLRKPRRWMEMRARYLDSLNRKKPDWRKEEKLESAKKIGRELLGLNPPVDEFVGTREEKLRLEVMRGPLTGVTDAEERDKEKFFSRPLIVWNNNLSDTDKEARYFELMGRDRSKEEPNEEGYSKEDLWDLEKEEKEILVRFYASETYWKYKETFDEKGHVIVPGHEVDLTGLKEKKVTETQVEAIVRKYAKKLSLDENRVYPEEVLNYFNEKHLEREGGFDSEKHALGRVKFNIDYYVKQYKNELEKREEEIKTERAKQQKRLDNKKAHESQISKQQETIARLLMRLSSAVVSYEQEGYSGAGSQIITPADLKEAAEIYQSLYGFFEGNVEEMLPELQEKALNQTEEMKKFQGRLWSAFTVQYSVIEQKTAEGMKELEKLMKDGPAEKAELLSGEMESRIKAVLFKENKLEGMDKEQEKKFLDLWKTVGTKHKQCEREVKSGRTKMVQEIRELQSGFAEKPKKEDAEADKMMGVDDDVRILRRASLLAIRCAAYREQAAKDQTQEGYDPKAFSRAEDLEYVEKTMAELKKEYLPKLESKLFGDGYQEAYKSMDMIVIERSKERFRINHTGDKSVKPPVLPQPELRYRIKYAKAYLALINFEDKEEAKKKAKKKGEALRLEQEKIQEKISSVSRKLNWIQTQVFEGRFTGLETEEEEENLLSEIRGKAEEIRRQQEKLEKEWTKQANNEMIRIKLEKDESLANKMNQVLDLKKTDQETWQNYNENRRLFSIFLKEGKEQYQKLDDRYREEREKMIELFMKASELEKTRKTDTEEYGNIKRDIQQQGLVVRGIIKERDGIWEKATSAMKTLDTNRESIQKQTDIIRMNLNGLIQMDDFIFETDIKVQNQTDNEKVNEVKSLRLNLQYGDTQRVLEVDAGQDGMEYLNFMLETRGEYLLKTAEERIGDAKKGGSRAFSTLRDLHNKFIEDLRVVTDKQDIPGMSEKIEAFNEEYSRKETEVALAYLRHLQDVSDQTAQEKIDKLPDQPYIDMKMLSEINNIITGRKADMDEVKKQINAMTVKDSREFQRYLNFCGNNYHSPEMKALRAKVEKPLMTFAEEQNTRTEVLLNDLKALKNKNKEGKLGEVRELFGEIEAYTRILTSFAPVIGVLDSLELLEKVQRKLEDAANPEEAARKHAEKISKMSDTSIFEMLAELTGKKELDEQDLEDLEQIRKTYEKNQKNKTFQNRLSKDPTAKKKFEDYGKDLKALEEKAEQNKAVNGLRTEFIVLSDEISESVSNTWTLNAKDLQHLQTLKKSLAGLAKGKVYQGLLKKEDPRIRELQNSLQREGQRIDRRLALHETEKTVKEEVLKLQKERDKLFAKKDPGSNVKAQEERAAALDELRRRYESLEESENYINLSAEKIGDFQEDVKQTVKTLKENSCDIKFKLLEAQFAVLYKDAMVIISKTMSGESSAKENEKLWKIQESLATFQVSKHYRDVQDDLENDKRLTSLRETIHALQQQLMQL